MLADFRPRLPRSRTTPAPPLPPHCAPSRWPSSTPGDNELHRAALAGNALSRAYAGVVHTMPQRSGHPASAIRAIGAHGQTVRHRPQEFDGTGYTPQLATLPLLAELTGITVVARPAQPRRGCQAARARRWCPPSTRACSAGRTRRCWC